MAKLLQILVVGPAPGSMKIRYLADAIAAGVAAGIMSDMHLFVRITREALNKLIPFMVRQAHHERNQALSVRPVLSKDLFSIVAVQCKSIVSTASIVIVKILFQVARSQGVYAPNKGTPFVIRGRVRQHARTLIRQRTPLHPLRCGRILGTVASVTPIDFLLG
jgi:hypothetical protein